MRFAAIFLCLLILPLLASAKQFPAPQAYDEPALKADCEKYLQSLDPADFAKNYPKLFKGLYSIDQATQAEALRKIVGVNEINALPLLIPFLQSSDNTVRIYASHAIENIVDFYSLKRRDPAIGDKVVLKPLTKDDPDFRPLGWVVLQMLRSDEVNLQTHALIMSRYVELRQFKTEIQQLTTSRHPAAVTAAKETLKSFDLPIPSDQ